MKNIKHGVRWLLVIAVGVFAIFYSGINVSDALGRVSSYFVYPVIRLQHIVLHPIKRWFEKKNAINELEDLVARSQNQSHDLLAELVACKAEACFFKEAHEIYDFHAQYTSEKACLAQVLVRQFSDESHFFLIDRGEQDGIAVDMVVVHKNCLVGRVTAVYPWYSKVLLITDRQCKVPALSVDNQSRGIYSGSNTMDRSSFDYVSHLAKVDQSELVISSGEGLIFPRGFGLGRIASFEVNSADYTYTITLEPLVDLRAIDYCSVIKKGTEYSTVGQEELPA